MVVCIIRKKDLTVSIKTAIIHNLNDIFPVKKLTHFVLYLLFPKFA